MEERAKFLPGIYADLFCGEEIKNVAAERGKKPCSC